jgi:nucleoside-diphosphate-sugar epimerase
VTDGLIIGGNRFMGVSLVWRMLFAGHRVTILNRGNLADPFGDRIERIRADPSRAQRELGFEHPRLDAHLESIIAELLAAWPGAPPEGYGQRAAELRLV